MRHVAANPDPSKRENIALLSPPDAVGVELGVAAGSLTKRFLDLNHFVEFHAVDKWDDAGHPESQYHAVCEKLKDYGELKIWRMTAQTWLGTIPDETLGFIYIDCYAHTGQDGGEILELAWPKLAKGGLFAGDDYERKQWPKTVAAVNDFASRHSRSVSVWEAHCRRSTSGTDKYPSWYWHK